MFSHVAGVSFFRAWKRSDVMICLPHSRRKGVFTMHLIKDENGNLIPAYSTNKEIEGIEYNSLRIAGDDGSYI